MRINIPDFIEAINPIFCEIENIFFSFLCSDEIREPSSLISKLATLLLLISNSFVPLIWVFYFVSKNFYSHEIWNFQIFKNFHIWRLENIAESQTPCQVALSWLGVRQAGIPTVDAPHSSRHFPPSGAEIFQEA